MSSRWLALFSFARAQKLRKSLSLFFNQKTIQTSDDLEQFVQHFCAKHTHDLIIKYTQKRLGKIHYNLSKDDFNYTKELLTCQAKLHAEITADIGHLIALTAELQHPSEHQIVIDKIKKIHEQYIKSAPEQYQIKGSFLSEKHFDRSKKKLKDLAQETGNTLFKLLPMTDNLLPSNRLIFQGQIRLVYIEFLQQLNKRIPRTYLKQILSHAQPQTTSKQSVV